MFELPNPYGNDDNVCIVGELTNDESTTILYLKKSKWEDYLNPAQKKELEILKLVSEHPYNFMYFGEDDIETDNKLLYTYNYVINGVKTHNEKQPYIQDSNGNYVNFIVLHIINDDEIYFDPAYIALAISWGDSATLFEYARACLDTCDGVIESNICMNLAAEQGYAPAIENSIKNYYDEYFDGKNPEFDRYRLDVPYEEYKIEDEETRFYKVKELLEFAFFEREYFCKSYAHFKDLKNKIINYKLSAKPDVDFYNVGLTRYGEYEQLINNMDEYDENTNRYSEYLREYYNESITDDYKYEQYKKYINIGKSVGMDFN